MKNLYFFLFFTFTIFKTSAQIIDFPDANFKARLLAASPTENIAWDGNNTKVKIDTNDDGEIQISEALVIERLDVQNSNISDLTGINFFTNMAVLNADNNQITTLTINGELPNIQLIYLNGNSLTSVTLSNLPMLDTLGVSFNQITSISLQGLPNLWVLFCNTNHLTTIDLSQCTALITCQLSDNQLTSIIFPNYPDANTPTEPYFDLSGNLFETLEAPNHRLSSFRCNNNPNLTFLNLKEFSHYTYQESGFNFPQDCSFSNCPALKYICTREADLGEVQFMINIIYGYTNCHVNTYCSFNPGGSYYTLQGTCTYDSDNNGCNSGDPLYPNMKYTISNGSNNTAIITGSGGLFHYLSAGTYTITPVFENSAVFTASPASASVSFPTAASPFTQDFCISANSSLNDLEVTIIPIDQARPGFNAVYKIVYKNKGTGVQSGVVGVSFDDSHLDFVSANPALDNQSLNYLGWTFNNLQPFETREITFTLNLNSPLENPPLNNDDILNYTATIDGAVDATISDNTSTLNQVVVGSYDPNDKTCLEGTTITPSMVGNYVHYVIRFENTGTANAENIVVKDIIDTNKFDISSLMPQQGSHTFTTRIINTNQVEFIFENIQLPFDDANNDGYVAFKIKTKPTLVVGDTFNNSANIYFDYNFPITTNTYTTTIQALGVSDFDFDSAFSLSPVPAKNTLTITPKYDVVISSVSVFNMLGQLVQVNTHPGTTIDVSGLKTGSYLIKITSDKGSATSKFIKE